MKEKWFYPLQEEARKKLKEMYGDMVCDWQVVSHDRVLEQYSPEVGNRTKQVLVHMIYKGSGARPVLLIYELNFTASN